MSYQLLTLENKSQWEEFFLNIPLESRDIYFTNDYYEMHHENGDGLARCFVFKKDGHIAMYPFLINSINKLGYKLDKEYFDIQGAYGYNGVISTCYKINFILSFYSSFDEFCKKNNIIAEFVRFHPLIKNNLFIDENIKILFDRKVISLNIDVEYLNIWTEQYSSKNRNMIRKGQKSCYAEISQNKQALNEFKKIYAYTMKKIYADNFYFFNEIYFNYLLNKHTFFVLVYEKDTSIIQGGMVLFIFGKYAHYHLSGRSEFCSNNSVNNFMLDEAIKFAIKNNCKQFHFGGGVSSNDNDTLLKFKKNFSKNELDFFIGKKIHNKKVYNNVFNQWQTEFPKSFQIHHKRILGYRYIS